MQRSILVGVLGTLTVALGLIAPAIGRAQGTPSDIDFPVPTPQPRPTISGTPLPYPAYGTPAPDVAATKAKPGIPQTVTLVQAVKIAVALSPVFANENAQWAAIHARYTSSVQALYPGLSGSGTLQQTRSVTQGIVESSSPSPTATPGAPAVPGRVVYSGGRTLTESFGLTLTQLIFDGGRTIANIRSAKEADYAARATLLRDLQTLELNVSTAYYTLLQDNATVVADNQLVHEFEVNEASVAAQIRNGAEARSDIATAQYQTAQARGNLVTAQGAAIGAAATFATTLGLNADIDVLPKDISKESSGANAPTYQKSLARALLLRPDYLSAAYSVQSDEANVRYAKLARFPVLSGSASYADERSVSQYNNAALFGEPVTLGYLPVTTLGLQLSVPIYDQGVTNYNVALAAAQLDEAKATLQQTYLTVQSDVRSGLANLISARAALVQAHAELVAAQVSLDATEAQYKVGATTIVNVVTTEGNLATAQSAYIAALYGVQTAQQNYLYALGMIDIQL